ncbi:hypothetical protein Smp_126810 [Schistosoma mansoni]|uniref:hypothetical protein n=1 Tax=Schistosoma mansoni TaxID=6183 RepID=UPI0001A63295|nr:hypothetical protein Smp_126810 [Schistosoma mansoni]|eukprot:XP_018651844.1 hypothetical protein Smp_126810 [Schistosoma mansoni]
MPKYSSSNPQSRKNRPLKRVSPRWRSTFPISLSQLQRKRDEFWDTAPAAEGRVEIWNALKVVADFFQKQDYDMAQAILDGACITLPSGTLYDCYDELGAHYQLPLYVLSQPSNLVPDPSTPDSQSLHSQPNIFSVLRNSNTYTSGFNNTRVQISDQNITVLEAKRLFTSLCGWHELRQRWFVCGRSLSNRLLIKDCHIPSGFVIQVIVHSPFDPECLWKQGNRSATSSVVEAIIS